MIIDSLDQNPIESLNDIATYNKKIQEQRLYQLLLAIDDRFSNTKKEIIKRDPRPIVEAAYNELKRAEVQKGVLVSQPSDLRSSQGISQGLWPKDQQNKTGRNGPRRSHLHAQENYQGVEMTNLSKSAAIVRRRGIQNKNVSIFTVTRTGGKNSRERDRLP